MSIKIIGTGLTGLVGSRIVELTSKNYDWIDFSLNTGVDITDLQKLASHLQKHSSAATVLHLAAFTDVNKAWEQKNDKAGLCYRVNVDGTANIAQLCQQHQKYLVHISTDFVFNGVNPPPGGYLENNPPHPIEWYGQTKYWAEQEVKKSGCNYTIVRIAFPYKLKPSVSEGYIKQNGDKLFKLDLVRKMVSLLKRGQQLKLFTDQLICPTWIDDIAQLVDRLIQAKPTGEIFHCVGSQAVSPYQLGQLICQQFDFKPNLLQPIKLSEYQPQAGVRPYQKLLVLNARKLYNTFGIKTTTISEGIKKYENNAT